MEIITIWRNNKTFLDQVDNHIKNQQKNQKNQVIQEDIFKEKELELVEIDFKYNLILDKL